jgi:hypothetical protein
MNAHLVGAPKLLGRWFAGCKDLGLAMGLYTLAFTAGVFLSLNVLGSVASERGSRPALQLLALLVACGSALVALVPGGPQAGISTQSLAAEGPPLRPWTLGAAAWVLAIAYFGYSIGTEAYLTFTPTLLVARGQTVALAASTVGTYAFVAIVLKPVFSVFLNAARAIPCVLGATATALLSVALLFTAIPPVASAVVMGISLALGMPAFMALPNLLLPQSQSGQAYGLYQLLYSLGFVAQPLVGAVVDRTHSYVAGFAVIALYTAIGFAGALRVVGRLRAPGGVPSAR